MDYQLGGQSLGHGNHESGPKHKMPVMISLVWEGGLYIEHVSINVEGKETRAQGQACRVQCSGFT